MISQHEIYITFTTSTFFFMSCFLVVTLFFLRVQRLTFNVCPLFFRHPKRSVPKGAPTFQEVVQAAGPPSLLKRLGTFTEQQVVCFVNGHMFCDTWVLWFVSLLVFLFFFFDFWWTKYTHVLCYLGVSICGNQYWYDISMYWYIRWTIIWNINQWR